MPLTAWDGSGDSGLTADAAFFFAFAGAIFGGGLIGIRVWVVERLRLNSGGIEPPWLRIAKVPVDVIIVLILGGSLAMCIAGFVLLIGGAT